MTNRQMTKNELIKEIMRRARYDTLDAESQERTRVAYMRMRKEELVNLLEHAPATWRK